MKSNEIEVDVNESYIARVEKRAERLPATLDAYPGTSRFHQKVAPLVIPTARPARRPPFKVRITIIDLEKYNFILPGHGA